MVDTIKFSEMTDGGDIDNNKKVPGLKAGDNVLFNNPWTFLPSGTTAQRPTPSADVNFRLRFNTTDQLYEYYDAVQGAWTQLQENLFTQGPFLIYEADPSIPDGQNLGALANGILKQTIAAGRATIDIAVQGTDYYGPGDSPTFAGMTMTGNIDMGGFKAINAADPINPQDYATKAYTDANSLTGTQVYAATTGSLGTVTQSGSGIGATLTNAGAQAVFSIDGVSPPLGESVLIKNTATGITAANEGIYVVTNAGSISTNWVLTRSINYDTPAQINSTGLIVVNNGSTLAGTSWYNTTTIVTVDTTNFNYLKYGVDIPVPISQGGTGAITAPAALVNLGAAASGINADITSMIGLGGPLRAPTAILDTAGNEVLGFVGIASAVNYFEISNNATGAPPSIVVRGTDTNINMQFGIQGSGVYLFRGTTAIQTKFHFYENETNGTNNLFLQAPATLANNNTIYEFQETGQTGYVAWDQVSTPAWTNFTPGFTGFSANPVTSIARYKKIGTTCFVELTMANGTSNATGFTITGLPFTSASIGSQITCMMSGANNNVFVTTVDGVITASTNVLILRLAGSAAGWTAALAKGVGCQFFYETA